MAVPETYPFVMSRAIHLSDKDYELIVNAYLV